MDTNEHNEKRLIAAEIIVQLWESKQESQLCLLKAQVDAALENLKGEEDEKAR